LAKAKVQKNNTLGFLFDRLEDNATDFGTHHQPGKWLKYKPLVKVLSR
jgi:hypothetical protein